MKGRGPGGCFRFGPDCDVVPVRMKENASDVSPIVARESFLGDGIVIADLTVQKPGYVGSVYSTGKIPDVFHIQKTSVYPVCLFLRVSIFCQQFFFEKDVSIFSISTIFVW